MPPRSGFPWSWTASATSEKQEGHKRVCKHISCAAAAQARRHCTVVVTSGSGSDMWASLVAKPN
eukprot:366379-Chlamydomonas_euryale.AAC.17